MLAMRLLTYRICNDHTASKFLPLCQSIFALASKVMKGKISFPLVSISTTLKTCMFKDSQVDRNLSVLNSTGAFSGRDLSRLSSSNFDPLQQQLHLASSSTALAAQATSLPRTNLILDFDGGFLQAGQGYEVLKKDDKTGENGSIFTDGVSVKKFGGFGATDDIRDELILQILAGVREDYANFNINVIWDDRGVNSPFYSNSDTVILITGSSEDVVGTDVGAENVFGIASSVDSVPQTKRDIAFVFEQSIIFDFTRLRLNQIIKSISHEAGHTFGLTHVIEDADNPKPRREIMGTIATNTGTDTDFDSTFSAAILNRVGGDSYSDVERLNASLGAHSTLFQNDLVSNQTLPKDAERVPQFDFVPAGGSRSTSDFLSPDRTRIDFIGDRDAFRFQVSVSGQYTIRETSSSFTPAVSLWDNNGDFLTASNSGIITFNFDIDKSYFVVSGSTVDRLTTFTEIDPTTNKLNTLRGNLLNGKTGEYTLAISKSIPIAVNDQFTVVENRFVAGNILANDTDPDGKILTANILRKPTHGVLTSDPNGSFTYTPESEFFGIDSFTYRAYDGLVFSEPATVSFTISEASLVDLVGTPGRDVLVGTDGRDRIIGLQSGDILTGGKGRDQFVFQNINEGGDRITDFTPGKDKIVLSGVLQSIGYKGYNPIADGIISFSQVSSNLSVIKIDPDGPVNSNFRAAPFILLDNITLADLSSLDNFIV